MPPSKSLLIWRLFHNKVSIDDQLWNLGFIIVSKCSICNGHAEDSDLLFFNCFFACKIWKWLCDIMNLHVLITGYDFWKFSSRATSPQGVFVINVVVIYGINVIWSLKNFVWYHQKVLNFHLVCVVIAVQVKLSCSKANLLFCNNLFYF